MADKQIKINVSELGRRGGRARAEKLSPAKRKWAAKKAAKARWDKWRAEHPEKPE